MAKLADVRLELEPVSSTDLLDAIRVGCVNLPAMTEAARTECRVRMALMLRILRNRRIEQLTDKGEVRAAAELLTGILTKDEQKVASPYFKL